MRDGSGLDVESLLTKVNIKLNWSQMSGQERQEYYERQLKLEEERAEVAQKISERLWLITTLKL